MSSRSVRRGACIASLISAIVAFAAAGTPPALARGGGDGGGGGGGELRVAGVCGKGASSRLRLRSRDGGIEASFEVHHDRAGSLWRVTIVHEDEVAYRGRRRTAGASRSFSVGYRVDDYGGADSVTARAVGPRGTVCVASATLPG